MTTKEQDKDKDRNPDGTVKDGASATPKSGTQNRGTRGAEDGGERAPASTTEFDYDPMQDPTFNKNEAQQFAESGHAGSDEAAQATKDAD